MSTQVQHRRGSTAQHSTFTGAVGEITVDTDKKTAVVHDGTTAGGNPLAKESGSNISATNLSASGTFALTGDQVQISEGGTGASTASAARTNLGLGVLSTADSVEAAISNSFCFRNRIINGGGQVFQRASATSLTAGGVYGADRWIHYCSGGTGITASCGSGVSGLGGATNYYTYTSGSWTSGIVGFAQRIESLNVSDMNGKSVTISGKVYQNTGSSVPFTVRIQKANSLDNFGVLTTINSASIGSIPSGVLTSFTATFTLGSSDASNGLQVVVESTSAITVSSKIVAITDMQLELGSVATPFELRPIAIELDLCQRYYQTNVAAFAGNVTSGVQYGTWVSFPVTMRAAPTVTFVSSITATNFPATAGSLIVSPRIDGYLYEKAANATGSARFADVVSALSEL